METVNYLSNNSGENYFFSTELEDVEVSGMSNQMSLLFVDLFNSELDIVDRNTQVFLQIKNWIENNDLESIENFLSILEVHYKSIHPSLIKSALIITDSIDKVKNQRDILDLYLDIRLK